jgi:hypothetical protein
MQAVKLPGLMLIAAFMLAGCSFASKSLWPTLTGASPAPAEGQAAQGGTSIAIAPAAVEASADPTVAPAAPPLLNTGTFEPAGVTPGQPTNTFVGQKVVTLRNELQQLQFNLAQRNQSLQNTRARIATNAQSYFGLMAAIMSRLQVGTTPGNPILQAQWNQAQVGLETINGTISEMGQLPTRWQPTLPCRPSCWNQRAPPLLCKAPLTKTTASFRSSRTKSTAPSSPSTAC